jgi:3-hydroxyisobutyrate dehydrogenase-like beta-hydroxyacid dehydrogenase
MGETDRLSNPAGNHMASRSKKIGFVGLGLMGHGMAKNLVEKGFALAVLGHRSRAPVDDLVARGAREATTLADLARSSDIVFTCVPSSRDVEALIYGPEGIGANARPNLVHIDCTTADPASTVRIAEYYDRSGIRFVDAALARGPANAEAGTLNLIVGGATEVLDEVRPALDCVAENVFHVGPVGAGHRAKLINNFIAMGSASLIADALTAARAVGVDLKALYDVISAGGVNSPMFQTMALAAVDGDVSRLQFSLANARKDIGYFVSMANDAGIVSLIGPAVLQALTLATLHDRENSFVPKLSALLAELNGLGSGQAA